MGTAMTRPPDPVAISKPGVPDVGAQRHVPEGLVRDFFAAMGPTIVEMKRNYSKRMAPDVMCETVGLPPHKGLAACLDYLDDVHARTGLAYCTVEVLHLAICGDVVLTERVDRLYRADRTEIMSVPLMGAVEVRNGLITRYTDYLDLRPLRAS